jgi:hypothetical protein
MDKRCLIARSHLFKLITTVSVSSAALYAIAGCDDEVLLQLDEVDIIALRGRVRLHYFTTKDAAGYFATMS